MKRLSLNILIRSKKGKSGGFIYVPYVIGISENFKRLWIRYNITAFFKTKHTLRSTLTGTRPLRDMQQTAQCVYSIPCECGRSYIGETGRPLAVVLREHRHNLKYGLLEKSKLAQRAYEEVIVHKFSRLRYNLFITSIPLYVSTLLGHPQVFTVVFNYISSLLLNYNANFHILTCMHSL
jgi:hypothetical protein